MAAAGGAPPLAAPDAGRAVGMPAGTPPGAGPFAFPDPGQSSEEIEDVRVVTLPQLVQLKLAARRYYDFGDVVFLIRVHNLDESFLEKLHPSVHKDFIECLEEKRSEDEYEARQDRRGNSDGLTHDA